MARRFICTGCDNKIMVDGPQRPTRCHCNMCFGWFDMGNADEMKSYRAIKEMELRSQMMLSDKHTY
ncbi:MAG: hypothetical protein Q8R37_04700 [Nanoarchaeota archaeon]|nr:hypothetical protein [Nanoarchaeota archaeon]